MIEVDKNIINIIKGDISKMKNNLGFRNPYLCTFQLQQKGKNNIKRYYIKESRESDLQFVVTKNGQELNITHKEIFFNIENKNILLGYRFDLEGNIVHQYKRYTDKEKIVREDKVVSYFRTHYEIPSEYDFVVPRKWISIWSIKNNNLTLYLNWNVIKKEQKK